MMIYTLTLNPSIDYIVKLNSFETGALNRMDDSAMYPGGKGINVSRVLKRLGVHNCALGFIGGWPGHYIEEAIRREGIEAKFTKIQAPTRINIKLKTDLETEINAAGPMITLKEQKELIQTIESLTSDDWLVLAGSIPKSLPATFYEEVVSISKKKSIPTVVDVSGAYIHSLLKYRPFLLKPNHHELGEWFDVKIQSKQEVVFYAEKLVEMGAQNVIVSMAGDGAIFVNESDVFIGNVPKGKVQNSVGAGDSLVGGFLAEYIATNSFEKAFQVGIASGSATAFSHDLCEEKEVNELKSHVHITKWK